MTSGLTVSQSAAVSTALFVSCLSACLSVSTAHLNGLSNAVLLFAQRRTINLPILLRLSAPVSPGPDKLRDREAKVASRLVMVPDPTIRQPGFDLLAHNS